MKTIKLAKHEETVATYLVDNFGVEITDIEYHGTAIDYMNYYCETMDYKLVWKTKGELIDCNATIINTYTACIMPMPWEIPHIVLKLDDGREVLWRAENGQWLLEMENMKVTIKAYLYKDLEDNMLRKVSLKPVINKELINQYNQKRGIK